MKTSTKALVGKLAVSQLVAWGVLYYAFSVLLGPMQDELGWSTTRLSAGFSVALLSSALAAPAVGRAVDERGPRQVMSLAALVGAAGLLNWSFATTYALYLVAWGLIGLAMAGALYEPAFAAIVRHDTGASRRGILVVSLLGALASTVFLPLTAWLANALGWRQAVQALVVALLVVVLPLNLSVEGGARSQRGPGGGTKRNQQAATDPRMVRFALSMALVSASGVAFNTYAVVFLVQGGQELEAAAFVVGLAGVAKLVGRLASGLAERWDGLSLLRASLLLQGLALVPALVGVTWVTALMMVLAFGAASGARTILRPAAVLRLFGRTSFGLNNGRITAAATLAKAASPLVFAALTERGGWTVAWGLMIGLVIVSAIVLPREGWVLSRARAQVRDARCENRRRRSRFDPYAHRSPAARGKSSSASGEPGA